MDDLRGIEQNVIKLLKQIPETRENDMILYYEYCINNWVRDIDMWKVFKDKDFRKNKGIPPFESVSRARRKAQERYPELRPEEKIEKLRNEKKKEFIDYARY